MDSEQSIREQILALARQLHALRSEQAPPFVPGETPVPYAGRVFDGAEMEAILSSTLDMWLTLGPRGKEFESRLAAYLGRRRAVLVNSGSSANLLAFAALTSHLLPRPLVPGDEVITVAAGFPTTVNPIVQYGCVPVFVDIEADTLNIDCSRLEAALSSRTRAVMVAHTLGNPFDVDAVLDFCARHDLFLVEDNCDALGSEYKGRRTGSFGHLATQSFYPPHHITMGEGGAVLTDDETLYRAVLSLRDWGRDCWCDSGRDNSCGRRFQQRFGTLPLGYDHKYVYSHLGYNLKPLDPQAALGLAQLEKLPGFTAARRANRERLAQAPRPAWLDIQRPLPEARPSWFGLALSLAADAPASRDQVVDFFEARRIATRPLFGGNLLRHPAYQAIRHRVEGGLARTDAVAERTFFVGVYPGLDEARLQHMEQTLSGLEAAFPGRSRPS